MQNAVSKQYVSCIRSFGRPILPPLMSDEKRCLMQKYRELASEKEARKEKKKEVVKNGQEPPEKQSERFHCSREKTFVVESSVWNNDIAPFKPQFSDSTPAPTVSTDLDQYMATDAESLLTSETAQDDSVSVLSDASYQTVVPSTTPVSETKEFISFEEPQAGLSTVTEENLHQQSESCLASPKRHIRRNSYTLEEPSLALILAEARATVSSSEEENVEKGELSKNSFQISVQSGKDASDSLSENDLEGFKRLDQSTDGSSSHRSSYTYSDSSWEDLAKKHEYSDDSFCVQAHCLNDVSDDVVQEVEEISGIQPLECSNGKSEKHSKSANNSIVSIAEFEKTLQKISETVMTRYRQDMSKLNTSILGVHKDHEHSCDDSEAEGKESHEEKTLQVKNHMCESDHQHEDLLQLTRENLSVNMKRKFDLITAVVRGYLTRRLMKTERVQKVIQTIKDTLECALKLHQESPLKNGQVTIQDVELHQRLITQLNAACYELHNIFFNLSMSEKMLLISQLRNRSREEKSPPPVRVLSSATQKVLQRKQSSRNSEPLHKENEDQASETVPVEQSVPMLDPRYFEIRNTQGPRPTTRKICRLPPPRI